MEDELETDRPAAFRPGELLAGRYRIARFIAAGGMGEVYEAHDLELLRPVALKTVRPDASRDAVDRLRREVAVASRVTHPNVCRVYDIGRYERTLPSGALARGLFLTMELLAGETLEERLERTGAMSVAEALPIVAQMAAGLAAAHDIGVVHRDFKPSNVHLVPASDGLRVVVTDFGLARGRDGEGGVDVSVTSSGIAVGTAAYMAPEQAVGKAATPRSDVYALGVVMFEMVTGAWPHEGGSPLSLLLKRLQHPAPRPSLARPDLDPRWETVILRCLEQEDERRYASVAEVVAALHEPSAATASGEGPTRALREVSRAASAKIRILIVDDHAVVRQGLAAMIGQQPEMEVVGQAVNGREGVAAHREHRPTVTLMDLRMPLMDGFDATRAIRAQDPDAVVVVLTSQDGEDDAHRALQAGAKGYLLKDATREEMVGAIHAAAGLRGWRRASGPRT